jgi:hypothetical protein
MDLRGGVPEKVSSITLEFEVFVLVKDRGRSKTYPYLN